MIGIYNWPLDIPIYVFDGYGFPAMPGRKPSGVAAAKRAKKKRRGKK